MSSIKITIASGNPVIRTTLRNALEAHTDLQPVGEIRRGRELERVVLEARPDVLLLDLNMPELDPTYLTHRLRINLPHMRVLVLAPPEKDEAAAALVALVRAFVNGHRWNSHPQCASCPFVPLSIRAVADGEDWYAPIAAHLTREGDETHARPKPNGEVDLESLTPREVEVLSLIGGGAANDEIAQELCISKRTVETHVHNIYSKLRLAGRSQAILYAVEHGLGHH